MNYKNLFNESSINVGTANFEDLVITGDLDISNLQTFIGLDNSTIEYNNNVLQVKNGGIGNTQLASGINAVKLADGSISNEELQYLSGASSNLQTQITENADNITNHIANTSTHGVSGNIVGTSDTQELSNKSLVDLSTQLKSTLFGTTCKFILVNPSDIILSLPNQTDTLCGISASQSLTNKNISALSNTISDIKNSNISATAAIDIIKLGDGSVSNTEFQYINSLTSNAQDQLDTVSSNLSNHIADTSTHGISSTIVGISETQTLTNKTINANNNTITNIGNGSIESGAGISATKIANGTVSDTEFQYINSLTSNAQDQLNSHTSDIANIIVDVGGFPDRLKYLTTAEINQLENIGATTIYPSQWGYLGASNQGISTTSNVSFNTVNGRNISSDGSQLDSNTTSITTIIGDVTTNSSDISAINAMINQNVNTSSSPSFESVIATTNLQTDDIVERTSGHGISIDGVLLKDSFISNEYIQGEYVKMRNNTTQAIDTSTDTQIIFNSRDYGDSSIADVTNNRLNIGLKLGYWLIILDVRFDNSGVSTATFALNIVFNGSLSNGQSREASTALYNSDVHLCHSTIVKSTSETDTVSAYCWHNYGSTRNIGRINANRFDTCIQGFYLGN